MTKENNVSIEDRLQRIEASLSMISSGLQQTPALVSIAADTIDEAIHDADAKGINIEGRLQNGLALMGRLSDPKINKTLNALIDLIEQAPGLTSMVADSVDEQIKHLNKGSVKLDDRIRGLLTITDKLSHPETVDRINGLISFSEQAPGLMAMTVDSVDSMMERYGDTVKDTLSFLKSDNLLFLKSAGEALNEAQNEPPAKVGGIFGLLRALKDPGRQKALGFLMNVLKNLGNKI